MADCGRVFSEQVSRSVSAQPSAAPEYLRVCDVLMVATLDRLARSLADFRGIIRRLNSKGAALHIQSMSGAALHSGTPAGRSVH